MARDGVVPDNFDATCVSILDQLRSCHSCTSCSLLSHACFLANYVINKLVLIEALSKVYLII